MPKAYSRFAVVAILLLPMVLSCSKKEAAIGSRSRGVVALEDGDYDLAITYFSEAIRLNPKDSIAYSSRGFAFGEKGEYDNAIADYTEAIRLSPTHALPYYNRGGAYASKDEHDRAIDDYTEAIRLNPLMADTYNNRGSVYLIQDAYEQAIVDFTEAIQLHREHAKAFVNRGAAYAEIGKYNLAIEDYTEAIRLNPKHAGAFNSLAWLLATCPDADYRVGRWAVENATESCELTEWVNPFALSALAAAYAEDGEFDQAVKWQGKAIEMATPDFDKPTAQSRLKLYEAGKPYREEL